MATLPLVQSSRELSHGCNHITARAELTFASSVGASGAFSLASLTSTLLTIRAGTRRSTAALRTPLVGFGTRRTLWPLTRIAGFDELHVASSMWNRLHSRTASLRLLPRLSRFRASKLLPRKSFALRLSQERRREVEEDGGARLASLRTFVVISSRARCSIC